MPNIIGNQTHFDDFDVDLDEVKLEAEKYERDKDDQNTTAICISMLAICERQNVMILKMEEMVVLLTVIAEKPPMPFP
jgi:hypothetical protein